MEPCSYHWGAVTRLRLGSLHDLLLGPYTPLLQELSAVELFSGRSTIVSGFRCRSHRSYLWNLMGIWCASRFWPNMTNHHPKCSKYHSYVFLGINYYKFDWAPKMIQGLIALARSFGSDRFCMLGTCGDLQQYNCGWMHLSWKTPKWNVLTLPHSVFMSNLVLQVLYVLSVNVESIRIYQILEQLKDDSIGLDLRQGFDIERDPVFGDFTSDVGFMKATELVLRLVEYGLLFGGLPCASFGFLSSPTHLRSAMEPWGNLKFPFVWSGNVFASRFSLLVCLCLVRKCTWMLEQPGKTTLPLLPPIQLLLQPNLKPRLIRWRGTQIFPIVWNWINFGMLYFIYLILVICLFDEGYVFAMWPRWMGLMGGWTLKPQLGLGNVPRSQLIMFICRTWKFQISSTYPFFNMYHVVQA